MRQVRHVWTPQTGPQVYEPSSYDGDTGGYFSAAPLPSHPQPPIEHGPLDLVFRQEIELGHVYDCLYAVSPHVVSDEYADYVEYAAVEVRQLSVQEFLDEHFTIIESIGHMKAVKKLRPRKNTWDTLGVRSPSGEVESPEEFTVRLWIEGDPHPFPGMDLEERKVPSPASESASPGQRVLERAVDQVGPDIVRKVLSRRRTEDQNKPLRYLASPAILPFRQESEFREGVDTDDQGHDDFYYLDDLARQWDIQWFTNRDTQSVWLDGETRY